VTWIKVEFYNTQQTVLINIISKNYLCLLIAPAKYNVKHKLYNVNQLVIKNDMKKLNSVGVLDLYNIWRS